MYEKTKLFDLFTRKYDNLLGNQTAEPMIC